MINNKKKMPEENFVGSMLSNVLMVFTNLRYLNCDPFFELDRPRLLFYEKAPTFFSSTLMELHIKVMDIDECLYLLDGRLYQLRTFYVDIKYVDHRSAMISQKVRYPWNILISFI
jgi:hypothetical protein